MYPGQPAGAIVDDALLNVVSDAGTIIEVHAEGAPQRLVAREINA
jgi:hypothetical protein